MSSSVIGRYGFLDIPLRLIFVPGSLQNVVRRWKPCRACKKDVVKDGKAKEKKYNQFFLSLDFVCDVESARS